MNYVAVERDKHQRAITKARVVDITRRQSKRVVPIKKRRKS
jgi:hypothetical protein